jgi:hypothetical protein
MGRNESNILLDKAMQIVVEFNDRVLTRANDPFLLCNTGKQPIDISVPFLKSHNFKGKNTILMIPHLQSASKWPNFENVKKNDDIK